MLYEGELRLLCDTFRRCRVATDEIIPGQSDTDSADAELHMLLGIRPRHLPDDLSSRLQPNILYRVCNSFQHRYLLFRLPQVAQETVLCLGPYLSEPLAHGALLELAEDFHVEPSRQKLLDNYYANLPVLPDTSHLFSLLYTFCEHIWGVNAFSVEDISDSPNRDSQPFPSKPNKSRDDILVNMKLMEDRYAMENALLHAVSRGQEHQCMALIDQFSSLSFEMRLDDPLRNLKNYSIITNTLMRKAAERGGVHPLYLDEISSSFAGQIEQLSSVHAGEALRREMIRAYCKLVRKHNMKNYSPAVQKTLLMIDADLSSDLSLKSLAGAQNINAAYLSTVFKKEVGKTVTQYVNHERIQLAVNLLETTQLQIQTIAAHCGILDVQYFSKLFKTHIGKTPKEYREFSKK